MENQEYLEIISKILNTDNIITSKEIEQVLEGIVGILANNKKGVEELTQETKDKVESMLAYLEEEHQKMVKQMEDYTGEHGKKMTAEMENMVERCEVLLQEVRNVMPKDGEPGKDADEEAVVEKVLSKIKLPEYKETVLDNGEQIVDKINELEITPEKQIDVSHIKGLKKFVQENQTKIIGGSITGRDLFKDIDLSAQLDGVTTVFNIQAVWNIISVSLSSYPYGALRKGVDYRWTPTSIEFLSTIDPGSQLQSGQQCILTVVLA